MQNKKVPQRPLGSQGLMVSAQGLGCMGMTAFYGKYERTQQEEDDCINTIGVALENGINFLDTAWIYQALENGKLYTNEELVGKAIKKFGREKFIIATKFGIWPTQQGLQYSGSDETIHKQLEDSLKRLGTDYIDLYYQHRMDPKTPIEQTMECLKKLVQQGKIRYIGLSECTPDELRRAHKIHPVSAIEMEWSLQTRDSESLVIPVARELGIGIVAYSPLGRGLLSQAVQPGQKLEANDYRNTVPRFQGDNFEKNNPSKFFEKAAELGHTPAQLALAWVHSRGNDVFPIPGTKNAGRLVQNAQAVHIQLTQQQWEEIEKLVPAPTGDRYADMKATFNVRV